MKDRKQEQCGRDVEEQSLSNLCQGYLGFSTSPYGDVCALCTERRSRNPSYIRPSKVRKVLSKKKKKGRREGGEKFTHMLFVS